MFQQYQLPYASDGLEPVIDALTVETHHGKHHAAYTKNFNDAAEKGVPSFQEVTDAVGAGIADAADKVVPAAQKILNQAAEMVEGTIKQVTSMIDEAVTAANDARKAAEDAAQDAQAPVEPPALAETVVIDVIDDEPVEESAPEVKDAQDQDKQE